jgi:ferredoxin
MTFVVTDNCRKCRFTDCVAVCPVDCFHADAEMLYIDPEECIDCGACVPECPVEAIYDEAQLPDDQHEWIKINAERAPRLPVINDTEEPLPTALTRKKELGFG